MLAKITLHCYDDGMAPRKAREQANDRILDTEALKGLAHPLRIAIFEALSTYGPATASGLGVRLDESSGATSYHLRQLAKHGFVREVEGRGTGRERWWERVPGGVTVSEMEFEERSAGREASRRVSNAFERMRADQLRAFNDRGLETFGPEWLLPAQLSTANLRLTADEFADLTERLDAAFGEITDQFRNRRTPGSRPVQVHLNSFPIVDGDVTPETAP